MDERTRIGLLGGAFDPPTNGHLQIALHVLASGEVDYVDFLPCYKSLHGKKMSSPAHRIEMCYLASTFYDNIDPWDYEIKNEFSGSTYEFVDKLLRESPVDVEYKFIIGMDNAINFDKWVKPELLKGRMPFIVLPRKGVDYIPGPKDWFMKHPHRYLPYNNASLIPEISSTMVRRQFIQTNRPAKFWHKLRMMVNPKVLEYIRKHNLYEQDII